MPVVVFATAEEWRSQLEGPRGQLASGDVADARILSNMAQQPNGDKGHYDETSSAAARDDASPDVVHSGLFVASEIDHHEVDQEKRDCNVLVERAAASPLTPHLPRPAAVREPEQDQPLVVVMDYERSTRFVDSLVVSGERRQLLRVPADESTGARSRDAELEQIATKERELAFLEHLSTAWRAEDELAWRELHGEPDNAARSVGMPTTAMSVAQLAQRERASLDNQIDWMEEAKLAWRELYAEIENDARSTSAAAKAKSAAPSPRNAMLAKPIEKRTISRSDAANGLRQV